MAPRSLCSTLLLLGVPLAGCIGGKATDSGGASATDSADTDGGGADDGGSDCEDPTTWYRDTDGDGYGTTDAPRQACDQPSGYVSEYGDCDDENVDVSPIAEEVCDELDNDCDNLVDDEDDDWDITSGDTWYVDADDDGYGGEETVTACVQPSGTVGGSSDCDDEDGTVSPGADEQCDTEVDEDCDGLVGCEDGDCADDPACGEAESCANGDDDDGDGLTDCDDDDCWGTEDCDDVSVALLSVGGLGALNEWRLRHVDGEQVYLNVYAAIYATNVSGTMSIGGRSCTWKVDTSQVSGSFSSTYGSTVGFWTDEWRLGFSTSGGCASATTYMLPPLQYLTTVGAAPLSMNTLGGGTWIHGVDGGYGNFGGGLSYTSYGVVIESSSYGSAWTFDSWTLGGPWTSATWLR